MKPLLRTSLVCLFIALALNAAFTSAQSLWLTPNPPIPLNQPANTPWLQLNSHNPTRDRTLKPQWTVIITSVKPSIRQIAPKRWEIEFSE